MIENYSPIAQFELIDDIDSLFYPNYEIFQHLDKDRFSHTDSLLFKFGRLNDADFDFAFNYDPFRDNQTEISYIKNLGNFKLKIDTDYSLFSKIPDYGANLEISGTF